jgi:hypothetical protein
MPKRLHPYQRSKALLYYAVLSISFLACGLFTDTTKKLYYFPDAISTSSLQKIFYVIAAAFAGLLFWERWDIYQHDKREDQSQRARDEALRKMHKAVALTNIGVITFLSPDPAYDDTIRKKIDAIIMVHPDADLKSYEEEIGAEILRVDRKNTSRGGEIYG